MVWDRTRVSGRLNKDANGKTDWNVSNCCVACANLTNFLAGPTITMKQFVRESRRRGKSRGSSRTRFPGKTWECTSSEYGEFNVLINRTLPKADLGQGYCLLRGTYTRRCIPFDLFVRSTCLPFPTRTCSRRASGQVHARVFPRNEFSNERREVQVHCYLPRR